MPYGNGKSAKTHDFRALPLAVGTLTTSKVAATQDLRNKCLDLRATMAEAIFVAEPLRGCDPVKASKKLLAIQSKSPLNSIYAQCCRISVQTAMTEHHMRYLKQLVGRLRHVATKIEADPKRTEESDLERKYYYVPVAIQDAVTPEEFAGLLKIGKGTFKKIVAFFTSVIIKHRKLGLNQNQIAIVQEIHRQVQSHYAPPDFSGPDTIVSLPLHYQALSSDDKDIAKRIDKSINALLLTDDDNAKYKFFLSISGPVPRGDRIGIPLAIDKNLAQQLASPEAKKGYTANALTLELGPNKYVGVRLVVSKKILKPKSIKQATHALVRDFGHKNTIAIALIKLDETIDLKKLEEIQVFTKKQAAEYLSTHVLRRKQKIVKTDRYSGRNFLARINKHAEKIDALRSKIDLEYNELELQRTELLKILGLDDDGQIKKEMGAKAARIRTKIRSFLVRLGKIREMKAIRRGLYRKIAALKKAWFGYLSNVELELAEKFPIVVIREDLTYIAPEKWSPEYKGRAFNKMINNGARGQYARRASAKFQWNGIPELWLPSYYTSTTCFKHAIVDGKQRKGDKFACKHCKAEGRKPEHADDHAALTLGAYLFLKPI